MLPNAGCGSASPKVVSLLEIGLGITDLAGHLFVPRVEQRHAD
jgi:hypothetical protein